MPLTDELKSKYFTHPIQEYYCSESGLRWYEPSRLGDSDFYEHLSTFPSYYNPGSWDKKVAVDILKSRAIVSAVDVGFGDAWLLREAKKAGISIFGTELNEAAVRKWREEGLQVFTPDDPGLNGRSVQALVSLQTLEHITAPTEWLQAQVNQFEPSIVIVAVPAHDTMLGATSDPLAWPPHHFTSWSTKALRVLAKRIGFEVCQVEYQPNCWRWFDSAQKAEARGKLWRKPPLPGGRLGRLTYVALTRLGIPWVKRAHTLLAVMVRP
jgi:hypothetical protein